MVDKRKQSLYFSDSMLAEVKAEAARQDRSLSWIMQRAWRLSRKQIMASHGEAEMVAEAQQRIRGS